MRKYGLLLLVLLIMAAAVYWRASTPLIHAEEPDDIVTSGDADILDSLKQDIHDIVASGTGITAGEVADILDSYAGEGASEKTPAWGVETVFNAAPTSDVSVVALSNTKFVVVYRDLGNSKYGTAVIGSVTGMTITYGSEYVFNTADTEAISVDALSDSKFVVVYSDNGSDEVVAIIGEVSGTNITYGSEYIFGDYPSSYICVTALSDTKFVVAWENYDFFFYISVIVGEVSGSVIDFGDVDWGPDLAMIFFSMSALSDTKFVMTYDEEGLLVGYYPSAAIGEVSGTTITFGEPSRTYGYSTADVEALSENKFVIASFRQATIGEVSGFSIEYGPSIYVPDGSSTSLAALSNTEFILAFSNYNSTKYGTVKFGEVSGTNITLGSNYVFNPATTTYVSALALWDTRFLVAYRDEGNSNYGTAIIGDLGSVIETLPADSVGTSTATLNGTLYDMGTACSVAVSFEYGTVSGSYPYSAIAAESPMSGTGPFHADVGGLIPGTAYYFRAKGVGAGTGYGEELSFTTLKTEVSTIAATNVGTSTATLNGTLDYCGTGNDIVSFEYGTVSGSYPYTAVAVESPMIGTGAFHADVGGLIPGTAYYFRAKGVGAGTDYGSELSFTALTPWPLVTTDPATNVGTSTATLNGALDSLGTAGTVAVSFEYGTQSGSYPYSTDAVESPMSGTGAFHADISGLIPEITYYFRAKAEGVGTDYGDELSFFIDSSLISYWPFDEGTGTIAYDSIGSNDGTLAGNTWWTIGISGNGLSFDGAGDYVSLPENITLRPARITQLAWVNPATLGGVHPIMSLETTTGTSKGAMLRMDNGIFRFYVGTGSDKVQYVSGTVTKANEWYQVVGTYDGTEACIWINGEKVDCEPLSGNISYDTARDMRIGSWAPATPQYFIGIIDEVRVYDRALTGQEIEDLYKQELVNIYVNLQGDDRPVDGWEVPINVGFYPPNSPDSWLLNPASATYYFSGTTTLSVYGGGTRAYFQCPTPVNPGTYDITADSETTLMNVKRAVSIQ